MLVAQDAAARVLEARLIDARKAAAETAAKLFSKVGRQFFFGGEIISISAPDGDGRQVSYATLECVAPRSEYSRKKIEVVE